MHEAKQPNPSQSSAPAPGAPRSRSRWPPATTSCCGAATPNRWPPPKRRATTSPTCPAIRCHPSLRVSADFDAAVAHVTAPPRRTPLLIAACPVAGLRPLLEQLKGRAIPNIVWLCKGFEYGTGLLPHQVVREVLGDSVPGAALSGPSFAQEVARGLPCGLTVASSSAELRERVVSLVHGGSVRVYACDDMVGVEVGGAVKNILAIATGAADGLGLGLNARAALITRGLAEITRLGTTLGAQAGTFMGLTGMGDLILTCTGDLSRNRRVGLALAQGKPLDTIVGNSATWPKACRARRPCASWRQSWAWTCRSRMRWPACCSMAIGAGDRGQLLARDPRNELA
jgi:glycerol-3-phosphate dehydrogenase (NAD(P)+)